MVPAARGGLEIGESSAVASHVYVDRPPDVARLGGAVIGGYELAHGLGYLCGDFTGGGGLDKQTIKMAGERPRYLHSFARDRRGTLYGAFSDSLGPAGRKGAIYRIDVS